MTKYNTVPTNRSDEMGNIVTEMVTWETSAVFGELELITREISILYSSTIVNDACMHVLHNWMALPAQVAIHCAYIYYIVYYTIQAVHIWGVSFLPSYQPFKSHHLVRVVFKYPVPLIRVYRPKAATVNCWLLYIIALQCKVTVQKVRERNGKNVCCITVDEL